MGSTQGAVCSGSVPGVRGAAAPRTGGDAPPCAAACSEASERAAQARSRADQKCGPSRREDRREAPTAAAAAVSAGAWCHARQREREQDREPAIFQCSRVSASVHENWVAVGVEQALYGPRCFRSLTAGRRLTMNSPSRRRRGMKAAAPGLRCGRDWRLEIQPALGQRSAMTMRLPGRLAQPLDDHRLVDRLGGKPSQ
jgi:hypothetical protein